MTDRASERRAIADKLSATIVRLTAEIAGCAAGTKKHARLVAQLERTRDRLPAAQERAETAEIRERERKLKRSRIEAANVGYMRRLDALRAEAPAIKARWDEEREGEGKRLEQRRKQLRKRTYKDTQGDAAAAHRHDWWRRPAKLPDPVQQPEPAELEDSAGDAPPREGLIPGTFKLVDVARLGQIVDRPRLPVVWTARHVGLRLIEAHRVVARIPANILPKQFGAAWPAYRHEFGEQVIQAGAGNLFRGRNAVYRGASADEMARCTEAIAWPLQFLSARGEIARDVNYWAAELTEEEFERIDDGDLRVPWDALQMIADALNAAREPVT